MGSPAAIPLGSKLSSWISRIKESSSQGKWQEVISLYLGIRKAGVKSIDVDATIYPQILKASSYLSHWQWHGKSLHACLIKQGFESSFSSIANSIMAFYTRSGDLEAAMSVFDSMGSRDSVSWNILIHGYLDHGFLEQGLWWFTRARLAGFEPNASTLLLVIRTCQFLGAKREGEKLHGYVTRSGFLAISSVRNSLLSMYADDEMESARKLFDEMPERDVISWSVMIGGYAQREEFHFSLEMFQEMLLVPGIEADGVTMVSILKACANVEDINSGRSLHGFVMRRGLDGDLFVNNSLIDMYSKCHDSGSAFKVFNEMPERSIISWNSLLSGIVLNGNFSEALSLIISMAEEGIQPDEVSLVNVLQTCKHLVYPLGCKEVHSVIIRRGCESNELVLNSLIDAYAKCNNVELAWEVFARMMRRDVVTWSTMIAGFSRSGKPDEAIAVFREMIESQGTPNAITIVNLLEACSFSAELNRSKCAHGVAIRRGFSVDVAVGTAIVNMYSRCGEIEVSRKAFNQIPVKNVVTWSAMIAAYGMNGLGNEALALLAEMKREGLQPNAVTTLSVLAACNHGGLVEEGLSLFKAMRRDHGFEHGFQHYSCVVDMLCRAGKLDSAVELIKLMPEHHLKASASIWGALLSACRSYGNTELGKVALSRILELEPLMSTGYVLASSMYAADGLWDEAARMRVLAKERGIRIVAGYSLVFINRKSHRFVAGESHQQGSAIDFMIRQLNDCMVIDEKNEEDQVICDYSMNV